MKKVLALILVLVMVLSLAACGGKPASDNSQPDSSEAKPKITATVCTPEAYDKAVTDLLALEYDDEFPTYDEVVEMFGAQGTVNADMTYEGYAYYDFTDGDRVALLTFQISGNVETYYAITGDIVDLMF